MLTLAGLALAQLTPGVVAGWWALNYVYLAALESVTPSAPAVEPPASADGGAQPAAKSSRRTTRTRARARAGAH